MLRECLKRAQPPLSRDGLLALGAERARLEDWLSAAQYWLSAALTPADWTAVERGVRRGSGEGGEAYVAVGGGGRAGGLLRP
jgi:hypothetical protein